MVENYFTMGFSNSGKSSIIKALNGMIDHARDTIPTIGVNDTLIN